MLQWIIGLVGIILTIFLVVGIHEFGHFIVARLVGVKVLCFSIGFGKSLYSWHDKKGTEYVLAAIPLGGYVKMLDETEGDVPPAELPLAYNKQPFYKKFAIIAAGPFFNILFAFVIYWMIFVIGFFGLIPLIGKITPNSIAAEAGMQGNQEIIQVDNAATLSWMGVVINLLMHAGDKDQLNITTQDIDSKQTKKFSLNLTRWHLDDLKPDPLASLGIEPFIPDVVSGKLPDKILRHQKYGPIAALKPAWIETKTFCKMNFIIFEKLLTGKVSLSSLGGPITIFASAGTAINHGFLPFLSFLAFLSIAIGFINVLPIPGLDGGHLLFQLIEVLIRRPIPSNVQLLLYRFGFIILILIIIQAMVNDIQRLA